MRGVGSGVQLHVLDSWCACCLLLSLLLRVRYGNQTGVIKINGNEVSLSQYSNLVGFVPQEDIMCV